MTRALFVSNGHGEDVIAAAVARRLQACGVDLVAVPLVGRGRAYERIGATVLGPRSELPGGGFTMMSLGALVADLRSGLLRSTWEQWRAVAAAAAGADLCVAVGDRYAVGVARTLGRLPTYFLHVNRSAASWPSGMPPWRPPFGPLERGIMRGARAVYARDGASAQWLRSRGLVNALDLGNPMLDAVEGEADVDVAPPWVMALPGTRADAYASLPLMLEAMRRPPVRDESLLVAWAMGEPPAAPEGWETEVTGRDRGVVLRLRHSDGTVAHVTRDAFATLLRGARVALSTSGTAAEQAAGLGVPVVGFPTGGPQYTAAFAAAQRRLLGDALTLVDAEPQAVATALRRAWADDDLRARAARAGERAMGRPGAAERIAQHMMGDLAILASPGA